MYLVVVVVGGGGGGVGMGVTGFPCYLDPPFNYYLNNIVGLECCFPCLLLKAQVTQFMR